MATIVNSIGSNGRDFASVQAWVDSIPTDLVGAGNSYIGEMYNDSEFTDATGKINIIGKTADATHFITLRCGPGQSFYTNPNRANNALWYNQANGVAINVSGSGATAMTVTVPYTVIEGLQVTASGAGGTMAINASGAGIVVKNCIGVAKPSDNVNSISNNVGNGALITNCLLITNSSSAGAGIRLTGPATMINCTVVRPQAFVAAMASSYPVAYNYGTCTVKNCAFFGFGKRDMVPNSFTASDYNATDWSQVPNLSSATHSLINLVYANQFVNADNDFRLKAGSDLLDKGMDLSASYQKTDIYGMTRSSAWDIGAYELPVPATALTITGPAVGKNGVASSNFGVTANGVVSPTGTVTLSDNGAGGTFTPATLSLSGVNPTATFTYTPSKTGDISITMTNNIAGVANPAPQAFKSANAATAITLTAPATRARAGKESAPFTAAISGYVPNPVQVVPGDGGDGGSFNPPFVTLDNTNQSATFTYVGASGGVKNITTTNNGSLTNSTVQVTEKPPIVAMPTPSTPTLVVKSIGTGKDFATLAAFAAWANTFDLGANQQSILGEVYESMPVGNTTNLAPKNATADYLMYLQPVPGMSVNYLDQGDPLDYGTEGIELFLTYSGGFAINRGLVMRDFRINISLSSVLTVGSNSSMPPTLLQRNRIKSTSSTNAVFVGNYTGTAVMTDNLFILDDTSTGDMMRVSSYMTLSRNTFVRRGNATGYLFNVGTGQGGQAKNIINDNVFINGGAAPIYQIELVPNAQVYNNYVDTAMAVPKAGITLASPAVRGLYDLRPNDNSAMIGKGSESAVDSKDIYSSTRGGAPDPGCCQGSNVDLLPKVTITSQSVNAQLVQVSGTTQYAPTDGTVTLVPDPVNPNGAIQQGPVPAVIGSGTFSAQFANVPGGNYLTPLVTLNNPSGYNRNQVGGEAISILGVTARSYVAEPAATVGNAPVFSIAQKAFDVTTYSVGGPIDVQGDLNTTLKAYVDFEDGSASLGPFNANIYGKKWGVQLPNLPSNFKVRLVGVGNGQPAVTVTSDPVKILKYKAAFKLPIPQ